MLCWQGSWLLHVAVPSKPALQSTQAAQLSAACLTRVKVTAAASAPSWPHEAEAPWKKERTAVGYTSPATSQVVALGPAWLKKEAKK